MNTLFFVANWKSHKTSSQAREFFWEFPTLLNDIDLSAKKIIVCPSYPALPIAHDFVMANNLSIMIGAQDISPFEEGAYTGEVNAVQVKEFAEYVIIGHSERKQNFSEGSEMIHKKVSMAHSAGLKVILCVQDENDTTVEGVEIIAYEPPSAIGTGDPDSPEHISEVFTNLHKNYPESTLLYGGSVSPETITQFLDVKNLGGFLIGGASLDPADFSKLISLC